jgi:signal transduction histidine kinase
MDFDKNLPSVPCYSDEMSQVILNIIVNAAHAISSQLGENQEDGKGNIAISTRHDDDYAEVRISDTGGGVPEEIGNKIFDPFFTTKTVGKGTGQGLSIAHDVVSQKHDGTLTFEVEPGIGTTFIIRLPLKVVTSKQVA